MMSPGESALLSSGPGQNAKATRDADNRDSFDQRLVCPESRKGRATAIASSCGAVARRWRCGSCSGGRDWMGRDC